MQYQSIIRLFEYCNVEYGGNMDAGRIKKILSAEFSIAPEGIITIDNFDYSKNDVLEELESPDFPDRLRCHKLIWEHQSLLNCLEQHLVYFSDIRQWESLKCAPGFVKFVSPYFATSFDKIMGKVLSQPPDFGEANRWMSQLVFVDNPEDEERALNSLRIFLLDTIKMLRNLNSSTYVAFLQQITPWAEQTSGSFINKLPDSFYKIKEDLVNAWVNFTHCISNKNRNLCYKISCKLIQITGIDKELRDIILHNHKVFDSKNDSKSEGGGCAGSLKGLAIIPVIIIIIKALLLVSTSNRNKHNNYPKVNFPALHAYEKFTSDDFLELRSKYATIYPAIFDGSSMDKDRPLSTLHLQYIMLEKPDTCHSATINIINNSKDCSLRIYAMNNEDLIDFVVLANHAVSIQINKNTLDFAFKIVNPKKSFPLIREMTAITLVSDYLELDVSYRTINFDNKGKFLNIQKINPSDATGLTLVVYSELTEMNHNEDIHNYMTFRNAEWCIVPKTN